MNYFIYTSHHKGCLKIEYYFGRELRNWTIFSRMLVSKYDTKCYFLSHSLDGGISTSASLSRRIKIVPFSCACAYNCVYATSENEIPLRHNTSMRIFTARRYICPIKTLDPDYVAPKQFSKMPESLDDYHLACLCLRWISFSRGSSLLSAYVRAWDCACIANENQDLNFQNIKVALPKKFNQYSNAV